MNHLRRLLRRYSGYGIIVLLVILGGVFIIQDPTLAQGVAQSSGSIGLTIARVFQVILGILLVVILGFLVYGAFLLSSAEGEEIQEMRAKRILRTGAIAFVAVAIFFGIDTFAVSQLRKAGTIARQGDTGARLTTGFGGFPASLLEAHYPENGQRNLSRNTSVMVTFSQPMNIATLIDDNGTPSDISDDRMNTANMVIVKSEDDPNIGPYVPARAQSSDDGLSFLFTPVDLLGNTEDLTDYVVIIKEGVASANGLASFAELGSYSWQFEVGTFVDSDPPYLVSIIPELDSTHPRNVVIQMTFNEAMNPMTVSGAVGRGFDNITVKDESGEFVEGKFILSNQYRTVEFITNDFCGTNACGEDVYCLPGNNKFEVTLRSATVSIQAPTALFPFDGITDAASNSFDGNIDGAAEGSPADDFSWNFATTADIDTTPPHITSVKPSPFTTNVSLSSPLSATFSKPLLFSSINHQSVRVESLGSFQILSSTEAGTSTVEVQHGGLQEDTTYIPTMTSDLRDIYQNCYRPCIGP